LRKRPTLKLEPNVVFKEIPKITLLVHDVKDAGDSSKIYNVVLDDRSDRQSLKTILAKWGSVHFNYQSERLILNLYDGEIHEVTIGKLSEYQRVRFHKYRVSVDVPGLALQRSNSQYRGDREKSVEMLLQDVKNLRKAVRRERENIYRMGAKPFRQVFPERLLAARHAGANSLSTGGIAFFRPAKQDSEIVARETANLISQLKMEQRIIKSYYRSINSLMVEVYKKYAIPAACIVFVLIGAPLGIMTRKGNLGISGGISVVFFLIYWIFLIGGEELADRQYITPFWSMWAANIFVGAAGIYLTVSSVREFHPLEINHFIPKFLRK